MLIRGTKILFRKCVDLYDFIILQVLLMGLHEIECIASDDGFKIVFFDDEIIYKCLWCYFNFC